MERVKRQLGKLWPFVLMAIGMIVAVLGFPYLASAYHLEAGGRALEGTDLLADGSLPALEHLQRAIRWDPNNAQAYRLLSNVHRVQGDWPAAVEALIRYNDLRPNSALGYIELAELYEEIGERMAGMRFTNLLAQLPQAKVETPNVPLETPFGQPDAPVWRYYVAPTSFVMPPAFEERPTLFMHPPAEVTFTLSVPPQPAIFRFGVGMEPQTYDWPGDGVTFEVFVSGERVFLEHLDKPMARKGWHERSVDLAPWAGQDVTLTLAVTPGPLGDSIGDWAGWGEPQVVDAQLQALEALEPALHLVEAWRRIGLTVEDLILRGDQARVAQVYEEARSWYERAIQLEPGLGDPWFQLGLLLEGQGQWTQALDAYEQAIKSEHVRNVGRSSAYYRMGTIYQRRLPTPQPERAEESYHTALALDDFRSTSDVAWTHARLGEVQYALEKDITAAQTQILKALELTPEDPWIYVILGDIYQHEGRLVEAAAQYAQALRIDPTLEAAQNRLDTLEAEE